ncbi:MAG: hypothetical protein NTU53_17105 [Planctomycetota bacterium]|nr:hypothetical protein [Planctomycetota bacterium]
MAKRAGVEARRELVAGSKAVGMKWAVESSVVLRLAERQFLGLLLQDPARGTRRLYRPDPLGHRRAEAAFFWGDPGLRPLDARKGKG